MYTEHGITIDKELYGYLLQKIQLNPGKLFHDAR